MFEAEKIKRLAALRATERAKRIMPLGAAGNVGAEGNEFLDGFGRVAGPAGMTARIELANRDRFERRHEVALAWIRVPLEEIGQLHQMAVRIVDQPVPGVTHGSPSGTAE